MVPDQKVFPNTQKYGDLKQKSGCLRISLTQTRARTHASAAAAIAVTCNDPDTAQLSATEGQPAGRSETEGPPNHEHVVHPR